MNCRPLLLGCLGLTLVTAVSCTTPAPKQAADDAKPATMTPLQRGEYIATVGGCNDCHTPGTFYGAPDFKRQLSGSELGWRGPWGVSYPSNLTPDIETGLGSWTNVEIERALRSGVKKDGTPILPPMPWPNTARLTPEDMSSLIAYLKSLPPVSHKVPAPLPPDGVAKGATFQLPAPPEWDAPRTQAQ
jgi:mono/diheme cytochrome c family protein